MKTQINHLRNGARNQVLNPAIAYNRNGNIGSSSIAVAEIWEIITKENPESIRAKINGLELLLFANHSVSGKTTSYWATISPEDLEKFGIQASPVREPSISIQNANLIIVSNGKNSYTHVCPSLVEII